MKVSTKWLQKYFDTPLPSGQALADAFDFHSFEVDEQNGDLLDLKVLPDRAGYALCHRGVASELAAALGEPLAKDPLREPLPEFPKSKSLKVEIEDAKKCPRYMAALVRGVKVGPSPAWLVEALESVGQRSVNNVVDATNYVMLDIGQPLHAFDADKTSLQLQIRAPYSGEDLQLLKTYITGPGGIPAGWHRNVLLMGGELLIADKGKGPLALAGIKGGKQAEISAGTTNIIIESANFDGTVVRRIAQALKTFTDASLRFQNRPSPELAAYGMRDVLALIQKIAGGTLEGVVDEYPKPLKGYVAGVSVVEANQLLGADFSAKDIENVFRRLNLPAERITNPAERLCALARTQEGKLYKLGASVRNDAPAAFDCSSFTSWLLAQVGICGPAGKGAFRVAVDQYVWGEPVEKDNLMPGDFIFFNGGGETARYESFEYLPGAKVPEGVDHVAIYLGDGEIISAIGGEVRKVAIEKLAGHRLEGKIVGYRRPRGIGEERFVVAVPFERTDLRIKQDLIEEVGRIIGYDKVPATELPKAVGEPDQARYRGAERMKDQLVEQGFTEVSTQSFTKKGDVYLANPLDKSKPALRTSLEENLKEALVQAKHYAPLVLPPKESPKLFEVGTVFPKEGEHIELRMTEVAWDGVPMVDNLSVAKLDEYGKDYAPKRYELGAYRPFSQYPFIARDIALWTPAGTEASTIEKIIRDSATNLLARLDQFDTFEKEGRVSYAFRLVFESMDRTLTDEEANGIVQKVSAALVKAGYEVR